MAWCPHCKSDRPINRQSISSSCDYCGSNRQANHGSGCRGPVAGWLDVCTYCNTPLFAQAKNSEDYSLFRTTEKEEYDIRRRNQFIFGGICLMIFLYYFASWPEDRKKTESHETPMPKFERNLEQTEVQEHRIPVLGIVDTPSGVAIRENPSKEGNKLGGFSNQTEFEIINQFGPKDEIEGKMGRWIQVKFKGGNGWIFDGFVKLKIQAEKTN